ncbi:MAG: anti-sigma factor family protein, partial [Anaerolineae bacterium]
MKIALWFRALRGNHLHSEELSAYLDGQVRPAERRRIEAHLAGCAACRRELASLRQTVALVRALPRVPVPRAFTLSQAQVGLGRPTGRPAWLGGVAAGLATVATIALLVIAGAWLRRPTWQPAYELARLVAPSGATAVPVERPVEATSAQFASPGAAASAAQEAMA